MPVFREIVIYIEKKKRIYIYKIFLHTLTYTGKLVAYWLSNCDFAKAKKSNLFKIRQKWLRKRHGAAGHSRH